MTKRSAFIVCAILVLVGSTGFAGRTELSCRQHQENRWDATWIECPNVPGRSAGVFHFRRSFVLDTVPEQFVVHTSGDNRYELFANGKRVLNGPARGDLDHWRYETLDLAPFLHPGRNALAAVVWNFSDLAPMAQVSHATGLIVQGDGAAAMVNTDRNWKVIENRALELLPLDPHKVSGYFVAGPGERWDASKYPWGWESVEFDDSAWQPAKTLDPGGPRGARDSHSRWFLVPRTVPLMEEKVERPVRIIRSKNARFGEGFPQGKAGLIVPPDSQATVLFDQTYLTTAYPELMVSGGRGAEISLTYAEALLTKEPPIWENGRKGNRNDVEGREILGFEDYFLPDGGKDRLFRPLWWRTYRFVQMGVKTKSEPVTIEDFRGLFTAYPFIARARFDSGDPELTKLWDVGWRTARLCAHETYMDTPYYEQLQYVGDTRIQALISLYMTGDSRLAKNAIELIDESRIPDGITQSRYPGALPQYIPPFSLMWIGMMHDIWWYQGETEFLKGLLPGSRGVLNWFALRLSASGLLGRLQWWNFVDWADEFKDGIPPEEVDGQSAILSLQFAIALREASDLETALGIPAHALRYREMADRIASGVRRTCWDESRKLIADTPAKRSFSQHANLLAVLADAVPAVEQKGLMQAVLSGSRMTQCTYYFRFYLTRAMKKAGLGDEYLNQLQPWRDMLALGLTTWAEKPEPTRSDCHAWSAHPNFDLLATVAGIEPAAAGFREVKIEPHMSPLKQLTAVMPHPSGEIVVLYRRLGDRLEADVKLPDSLSGWFYWRDKKVQLRGGAQHLSF